MINGKGTTSEGIVFAPKDQITRAEITKLIVNAFDIQGSGTDASFNDVTSDTWYYNVVGAAFKSGIITGTSTATLVPNAPTGYGYTNYSSNEKISIKTADRRYPHK